jgi:MSHA biogenesis protein MshI
VLLRVNRAQPQSLIGLELQADGLALAVKVFQNQLPHISRLTFLSGADDSVRFQQLHEYVRKNKLKNKPCNLVLPESRYQLYLLEAPDVPPAELSNAMKWRLKDLVTQPLDQLAIDVFYVPNDSARGNRKMIYVVVVNKIYLQELIEHIRQSGLKLLAIDIAELALRNLAIHLIDPQFEQRGVAIARLRQGAGLISIYRAGDMYLSRHFDLAYGGGLLDDLPIETLALELQRSVDYYERQMGQLSPVVIYVCGENIIDEKITDDLRKILSVPVQFLDFSGAVTLGAEFDNGIMQLSLGALGAAMRQEFA